MELIPAYLRKIRRGDLSILGPLSDYLEEYGDPRAKQIAKTRDQYWKGVRWSVSPQYRGRNRGAVRNIALWMRWARNRVRFIMIGKKRTSSWWQPLSWYDDLAVDVYKANREREDANG